MISPEQKKEEFELLQAKIFNQLRRQALKDLGEEPNNVELDKLATERAKAILHKLENHKAD